MPAAQPSHRPRQPLPLGGARPAVMIVTDIPQTFPEYRSRSWETTAGGDLAVEVGRAGDDDGPGRLTAGDGEAVLAVAGHEHEGAGRRRPAVVPAKAGELSLKQVEHLVLAGVDVRAGRQPRRVSRLHDVELAERVIPGRLDHDAGPVEVIGRTLPGPEHEPRHHRSPASPRFRP